MSPFIMLQQNDEGLALWFWLLFILLPLLGRIFSWIAGKLNSIAKPEAEREGSGTQRTERKERERSGTDAWKRMLQGELPEAEPPPPPTKPEPAQARMEPRPAVSRLPRPTPALGGPLRPRGDFDADPLTSPRPAALREKLPSYVPPTRDSVPPQDEQRGPSDPGEGFAQRLALQALSGAPASARGAAAYDLPLAAEALHLSDGGEVDWRRAMVLNEILGAPVSLRAQDSPNSPAGLR